MWEFRNPPFIVYTMGAGARWSSPRTYRDGYGAFAQVVMGQQHLLRPAHLTLISSGRRVLNCGCGEVFFRYASIRCALCPELVRKLANV